MKIEVSYGELFDKISILEIKRSKIKDSNKLQHIIKEHDSLLRELAIEKFSLFNDESYVKLKEINLLLWDIEDRIRQKEKLQNFDTEFIKLSRQIYKLNDERFNFKNDLSIKAGSSLYEQKSHDTCTNTNISPIL